MINTQQIILFYTGLKLSSGQIGKLLGCSRAYVWKVLKSEGIKATEKVVCNCDFCGVAFKLHRSKWRRAQKHYCCEEHYFVSRENPRYSDGTRLARAIVSQHFQLKSEHVVHHLNGDNRNNNLNNLAVFADQAHYLAWHRGHKAKLPIWNGNER